MNAVFVILVVLIVIASVLLIGVVLLQNSKGGGLASNFVAGNQTFGVRQTADLLEKITWALVTFILVVSIASTFALRGDVDGKSGSAQDEAIAGAAEPQAEFPTAELPTADPAAPAAPVDAPAE